MAALKLPNKAAKMLEVTPNSSGGGREGGRTEKPCWKFFYCPVLLNNFHSDCELTINSMLIISYIRIEVVIVLVPSVLP